MGQPRSLYLHVGTHKTGSTSFQRYLKDHQEDLGSAGVTVLMTSGPDGRPSANNLALAHSVLRPGLRTGMRMRSDDAPGGLRAYARQSRALRDSVNGSRGDHLLLSAEAFCFARTRAEEWRIRLLQSYCGVAIRPILCFRNQRDWRRSWEAEIEKWRSSEIRSPGIGMNNVLESWYYDRDAILAFWRRFGEVRVVDYDLAMAQHGSIIPALLEAADAPRMESDGYWLNSRSPKAGEV